MSLTDQFLTELQLLGSGGGWIFWVLVALAFGIAYALITLWTALRFPDATLLSSQEWLQLLRSPSNAEAPMRRLSEKLETTRDPELYLQEIGQRLFSKPDRRFPFAFVMIGSAPLLGLLGTVSGMFKTFLGIATNQSGSPMDVISGGIYEALITTMTGLVIGVPTYIICTWLRSQYDEFVLRFRQLESQLLQNTKLHS